MLLTVILIYGLVTGLGDIMRSEDLFVLYT
jgi:hypothetical protein